jgi:uncharacterized protein (DUF342 family)
MSLTIAHLKDKFKEMQYTGKLPTKKQELLDLYEKLYGTVENIKKPKMTAPELKKKLNEMGYGGKIPVKNMSILY